MCMSFCIYFFSHESIPPPPYPVPPPRTPCPYLNTPLYEYYCPLELQHLIDSKRNPIYCHLGVSSVHILYAIFFSTSPNCFCFPATPAPRINGQLYSAYYQPATFTLQSTLKGSRRGTMQCPMLECQCPCKCHNVLAYYYFEVLFVSYPDVVDED